MTTRAMTIQGSTTMAVVHGAYRPAWAIVTLAVGLAAALAIANTLALLLALALAAFHAGIETPAVRRLRARRARRKQRGVHHERRKHRLEEAGAETSELRQLTEIVDHIVDRDAPAPFEIEALLDRYVELATARQRCFIALAHANPACLEAKLAVAKATCRRSAEVLERRITRARALAETAQRLDEDIAELTETIRYCGERAEISDDALPVFDSDLVASALAYYDAYDVVGAR